VRLTPILYLILLLTACGPALTPSASVNPGPNAGTTASAPRIEAPPIPAPAPPGTSLPDFACADASGGKTGVANTMAARVGSQPAYDRFVLQFDPIVPTYTVKRQPKAVFPLGASGQNTSVQGNTGVLVTVHSATGATTFVGSTDIIQSGNKILVEAKQTQDFEGYVSWGLGLTRAACMRVFTLSDPARLVVDFQITTS
jgi:hypothetical protein